MVNEINKPQDPLNERMAASSRQLAEMQEEHRQLLQEMEVLRGRASELTQMTTQRQQIQQQQQRQRVEISERSESVSSHSSSAVSSSSSSNVVEQSASKMVAKKVHQEQQIQQQQIQKLEQIESSSSSSTSSLSSHQQHVESAVQHQAIASSTKKGIQQTAISKSLVERHDSLDAMGKQTSTQSSSLEQSVEEKVLDDAAEDDPAEAEYIKQKIAEIAALKAQYSRVQEMVNTTNLIEQHLASKTKSMEIQESVEQIQSRNVASSIAESSTSTSSLATSGSGQNPNEELLSTMLDMFTNFNEDLKGQAESLRSERERIKAIKEDLMTRRQERPKEE